MEIIDIVSLRQFVKILAQELSLTKLEAFIAGILAGTVLTILVAYWVY